MNSHSYPSNKANWSVSTLTDTSAVRLEAEPSQLEELHPSVCKQTMAWSSFKVATAEKEKSK